MEWISIETKLPSPGQPVLVTDGKVIIAVQRLRPLRHENTIWWDACCISGPEWEWDFDTQKITHWQPMPALPEDK